MILLLTETAGLGLLFRILILVVAYLIVKFTRSKLLKKLNKLMMTSSVKAEEAPSEELVLSEKKSQKTLLIKEITENTELSDSKTIRDRVVANATAGFKKLFFADLLVVAIYGLLPWLWSYTDNYIDELSEFCKKNNKTLILFTSPKFDDNCKYDNIELSQILKNRNLDYYDFTNFFKKNNAIEYWKDKGHLSNKGAELFTEKVRILLNENKK